MNETVCLCDSSAVEITGVQSFNGKWPHTYLWACSLPGRGNITSGTSNRIAQFLKYRCLQTWPLNA